MQSDANKNTIYEQLQHIYLLSRVSVQGVKSLSGHFACFCRGFDFYEVKKIIVIFQKEGKYFYTFNYFYSEKSSKEQNSTNLLL